MKKILQTRKGSNTKIRSQHRLGFGSVMYYSRTQTNKKPDKWSFYFLLPIMKSIYSNKHTLDPLPKPPQTPLIPLLTVTLVAIMNWVFPYSYHSNSHTRRHQNCLFLWSVPLMRGFKVEGAPQFHGQFWIAQQSQSGVKNFNTKPAEPWNSVKVFGRLKPRFHHFERLSNYLSWRSASGCRYIQWWRRQGVLWTLEDAADLFFYPSNNLPAFHPTSWLQEETKLRSPYSGFGVNAWRC